MNNELKASRHCTRFHRNGVSDVSCARVAISSATSRAGSVIMISLAAPEPKNRVGRREIRSDNIIWRGQTLGLDRAR